MTISDKLRKGSMMPLTFQDVIKPGLPACVYPYGVRLSDLDFGHFELAGRQKENYNDSFGFCLVSDEVLTLLARLLGNKLVLDAGSGSGWLSDALTSEGACVTACDRVDYRQSAGGGSASVVYKLDHVGDAIELLPGDFAAVLLIWPNYRVSFAEDVVRAMRAGQMLIFQGEGCGGACGTDAFFKYRDENFVHSKAESKLLNHHHVRFPLSSDSWWVGVKMP